MRERSSRHTVTPSPSGSRTSSTATSGRSAGTRASASEAFLASPITVIPGSPSRTSATPAAHHLVVVQEEHRDRRLLVGGHARRPLSRPWADHGKPQMPPSGGPCARQAMRWTAAGTQSPSSRSAGPLGGSPGAGADRRPPAPGRRTLTPRPPGDSVDAMDETPRVLVGYATAAGSTQGIAERIAAVLRDEGCEVGLPPGRARCSTRRLRRPGRRERGARHGVAAAGGRPARPRPPTTGRPGASASGASPRTAGRPGT